MATFAKKLERLLEEARGEGVIDVETSARLAALAERGERRGGWTTLTAILGWFGGSVLILGVILIVSANWRQISDATKLAGFILLFAATHGAGLWLRWRRADDYRWTAETFNFIGAGLFMAGIGLVAQIYHLDANPAGGALLWLIATAPLAWLLRSPAITVVAIFALLLWGHLFGAASASVWATLDTIGTHLMLELGVGIGLLGAAALLNDREPLIAASMRAVGIILVFGSLYLLGFYRHFTEIDVGGTIWLPAAALAAGAILLGVAGNRFAPEAPAFRPRLLALLWSTLALGAVVLLLERGWLPRGPQLEFFNFGWNRTHALVPWIVTVLLWIEWFALALWCVAYGSRIGERRYVNVGVVGFGLGIITRFFDLFGSLGETGFLFLVGGAVLLATAWGMERWRRAALARMEATA